MSRLTVTAQFVFLMVAPASVGFAAGAGVGGDVAATALALRLDGVEAGLIERWEGGDRRLSLTLPAAGASANSAHPEVAPLEFALPASQAGAWITAIQDFMTQDASGHRLVAAEYFFTRAGPPVLFSDVRIQELTIAELPSGGQFRFSLSAANRAAATESAPTGYAGARVSSAVRGFVSVTFSGMGAIDAVDVRPIVLRGGSSGAQLLQPLVLDIPVSRKQPFQDWLDTFLGGAGITQTVTVSLLEPDAVAVRCVLTLADAFPIRVARDPQSGRYLVSLFSSRISIAAPLPAPASTTTSPSPTGTNPAANTDTGATASTETTATLPAPTTATTPPAVVNSIFPTMTPTALPPARPALVQTPQLMDVARPVAREPVSAITTPVASSPAYKEQGLRDPAGFPRPAGLTRTAYTNTVYSHRTVESASYASTLDFDGIWNAYQTAATAAGWAPDGMNESGTSPETRMILSNWRNGSVTTDLRIYGAKDGGVTVSVTVTTDK